MTRTFLFYLTEGLSLIAGFAGIIALVILAGALMGAL